MSFLSNIVLPPWLNLKWIAMWAFGLAFFVLLWSWADRGHQVQRLADFQRGVISAVSDATVEPDKNGKVAQLAPEQIVPAITGLKSSYTSARTVLATVSRESKQNKARADAADTKLATQLATFNSQYAIANRRIQFLLNRPPAKPEDVCKVIEDDTNSAWDGWK